MSNGVQRGDHEVILFQGSLIPILGTVGSTDPIANAQTAANIERFLASIKEAAK